MTDERSRWWVVGAGRAGTPLARALAAAGHDVTLVARRAEQVSRLAAADAAVSPGAPAASVALLDESLMGRVAASAATPARVLLAVPDSVVPRLASRFAGAPVVLLHLSGAMGVGVLRAAGHGGGVAAVHPLRTFASAHEPPDALAGTLFGVTTSEDAGARCAARELVAAARGRAVELDEGQRPAWHLAATLASNGVFALLHAASQVLADAGVDGEQVGSSLASLAAASATNVGALGVAGAATGPVVRGDERTIATHAGALVDADPDVRALWSAVTMSLVPVGEQRGASERSLAAIRAIVAGLEGGERR